MANRYYTPKPGTVFVHLEDMVDFGDPLLRDRRFTYLGGWGLVYKVDPKSHNCNYPLTLDEFAELPNE